MERLDKFLVQKGHVESRAKAQQLIGNKCVKVNGVVGIKASMMVDGDSVIEIVNNEILKYVSRAGLKLEKAFEEFSVSPKNKVVLDIGSSTGGFTDCALKYGAKKVVAVDVGTNVMVPALREHSQVELHENLNIKDAPKSIFEGVELVVCDVSFISLKHIVEKVSAQNILCDMVCLIKPQFECGAEVARKFKGVIKSKTAHKNVINSVIGYFNRCGFFLCDLAVSPIQGGDGNVEYISHFSNMVTENVPICVEKIVKI